jgi:hypothetical protein
LVDIDFTRDRLCATVSYVLIAHSTKPFWLQTSRPPLAKPVYGSPSEDLKYASILPIAFQVSNVTILRLDGFTLIMDGGRLVESLSILGFIARSGLAPDMA